MSCQVKNDRKTSTLPPPCHHCRPPRFSCPKYGCPSPEACPPWPSCPEPCSPLRCRQPPERSSPAPPTLCMARPCPGPVTERPRCFSPPPKIKPPQTSVRFCIKETCEGSTYCPCYEAEVPRCNSMV